MLSGVEDQGAGGVATSFPLASVTMLSAKVTRLPGLDVDTCQHAAAHVHGGELFTMKTEV